MELYITTKNTGPTQFGPDPLHFLYMGESFEEAVEKVATFVKYECPVTQWPAEKYLTIYSILPMELPREMVKYYMADGWWYSIVKVVF